MRTSAEDRPLPPLATCLFRSRHSSRLALGELECDRGAHDAGAEDHNVGRFRFPFPSRDRLLEPSLFQSRKD